MQDRVEMWQRATAAGREMCAETWDSYQALKSEMLLDAENGAERRGWGGSGGFYMSGGQLADLCSEISGWPKRKHCFFFLFMAAFMSHDTDHIVNQPASALWDIRNFWKPQSRAQSSLGMGGGMSPSLLRFQFHVLTKISKQNLHSLSALQGTASKI